MSAQAGAADADPRTGTPADPEPCEELVVALVAALGTDLDVVEAAIEDAFSEFDYRTHTIRLSARLAHEDVRSLTSPVSPQPEYERIKSSMSAGDTLRGNTSDDFLAQLAVAEIATLRLEEGQPAAPMGRRALILRSLK
ncbi:MAG: hypothetical protein ACE37F_02210 [Nannocystaceae bacterium]|nr:hypothetical protein [bacterium]